MYRRFAFEYWACHSCWLQGHALVIGDGEVTGIDDLGSIFHPFIKLQISANPEGFKFVPVLGYNFLGMAAT